MLSTFIQLPFVIQILVLSIFEWSLKTGFTVVNTSDIICLLICVKKCSFFMDKVR